jgi:hypothetical protein
MLLTESATLDGVLNTHAGSLGVGDLDPDAPQNASAKPVADAKIVNIPKWWG